MPWLNDSMAAFAALAGACQGMPVWCSVAVMWMYYGRG
jgi:hypothetical protein